MGLKLKPTIKSKIKLTNQPGPTSKSIMTAYNCQSQYNMQNKKIAHCWKPKGHSFNHHSEGWDVVWDDKMAMKPPNFIELANGQAGYCNEFMPSAPANVCWLKPGHVLFHWHQPMMRWF